MNARHVSLLLLAALAACDTTASLVELREAPPASSPYAAALAARYRDYAEDQLARYDWWSSKYFADKGLAIAGGFESGPEDPKHWNISAGELPELEKAREALLETVTDDARKTHPDIAADAVVAYDCWVENMDDGWQNPQIEKCRDGVYTALGKLTAATADPAREASLDEQGNPLISSSMVLYFPFDSAHLEGAFLKQMQALIQSLKENPKTRLVINGHADRAGTDDYNLTLSARRAEYVKDLLVRAGLDASRIDYYAFGESDPAIDTPDNVREKVNRRVELFLE